MKNHDVILLDKEKPTNLKRVQSSGDVFFISSVVYISAANFSHPSCPARINLKLVWMWRISPATRATTMFLRIVLVNGPADTDRVFYKTVRTYNPSHGDEMWAMFPGPGPEWLVLFRPTELFGRLPHTLHTILLLLRYYMEYLFFFCEVKFMTHIRRDWYINFTNNIVMLDKSTLMPSKYKNTICIANKKSNFIGNNNDKQQFATPSNASFAIHSFPEILNLILKLHN
jgi:hypothetical protein